MTTTIKNLGPVEIRPIDTIREYEHNPRNISDKAVEMVGKSLVEFGWQQPLVVDTDGVLIVGHTRLRAARALKQKVVPVVVASDLTPEQARAYRIADNRSGEFATWDFPELAQELAQLDDFADVLALADWDAIMKDFEDRVTDGDLGDLGDEGNALRDGGFELVVSFYNEEDAQRAQATIAEIPGVYDIRVKR